MPLASPAQPASSGDPENPGGFQHIPALDGIRGLAILLVLFFHLFASNPETGSRLLDLLNQFRESCYLGVNLFFVLSGFLITGILLDTRTRPHFFKTFYARRALRIFPLYYGVLVVLLLLTRPLHFIWSGWPFYYFTYTANLALWNVGPLNLHAFNINHFWSLQVEEQFYLVWPFLVYRIKRLQTLINFCLLTCLAILTLRIVLVALRHRLDNLYLPYSPTFSCADNLLFGCSLCILLRTSARQRVLALAPRVLTLCAAILLIAGLRYHGLIWETNFFVPTFGFTLVAISCAALIAMALRPGSKTQQLFTNQTLRFFGRYSYGIYVFHYSLENMLNSPVRVYVSTHLHSKALGVVAGAFVVMAATIPVALLSYHFYEARFLSLKRYFSYNKKEAATPLQAT
jgi:peptidoglycan/LPS O-acetylase OafA/YrhL